MVRLFFLGASLLLLASCGRNKEDDNFGKLPEVPSHLRAGGAASVKITPADDRVVAIGVDPASLTLDQGGVAGLTPESELIFTDPDNVEASEAAIEGLFGDEKIDWYQSHTVAKNRALLESKPLLIVFTDTPSGNSPGSPAAARLEAELLARLDFAEWAKKNVIRLKLDSNVKDRRSADPSKQSLALRKAKYLETLRKQYKVGGFPAIIVVAADGTVVQHVRGYKKGAADYTWGLLKQGVFLSDDRQKKFEARLEKRGYRRWAGKNDQTIFARLAKYQKGELLLIAPNGARFLTKESNLSKDDRSWIETQKEKRAQR